MESVVWVLPLFMVLSFTVGFFLALYSQFVFKSGIQKFFCDEIEKAEQEILKRTEELKKTSQTVYTELEKKLRELSTDSNVLDVTLGKDTLN